MDPVDVQVLDHAPTFSVLALVSETRTVGVLQGPGVLNSAAVKLRLNR